MQVNATYPVPNPYGALWLVVDHLGNRWTPIAALAEFIGLPVSLLLTKMDKGHKHRAAQFLCNATHGRRCLPVDRVAQLANTVPYDRVPQHYRQAYTWLHAHGYAALNGFKVPAPVLPSPGITPPAPVALGLVKMEKAPAPAPGLQTFNFGNSPIRTSLVDGEPFWVAKDVAEALGYSWQKNLTNHVPGEWKGINRINTPGGIQEMLTLSEQGLYFFLGRSDKPAALPMQKWIAGEVLPSIRKTGSYGVTPFRAPKNMLEALEFAAETEKQRMALACRVEEQGAEIQAQGAEIQELKPKALGMDLLYDDSDGSHSLMAAAKALKIAPRRFTGMLDGLGWIFRKVQGARWNAKQERINAGYLKHDLVSITHRNGSITHENQVKVTNKGMAKLAMFLEEVAA